MVISVTLGTGAMAFVVLCMLVLLSYPSTLASPGWKGQAIYGERKCSSIDIVAVSVSNHRLAGTGIRTPVPLVGNPATASVGWQSAKLGQLVGTRQIQDGCHDPGELKMCAYLHYSIPRTYLFCLHACFVVW